MTRPRELGEYINQESTFGTFSVSDEHYSIIECLLPKTTCSGYTRDGYTVERGFDLVLGLSSIKRSLVCFKEHYDANHQRPYYECGAPYKIDVIQTMSQYVYTAVVKDHQIYRWSARYGMLINRFYGLSGEQLIHEVIAASLEINILRAHT